jgi:hypothetical protein
MQILLIHDFFNQTLHLSNRSAQNDESDSGKKSIEPIANICMI